MELERDFTFSLNKYPSLIFVFLVVTALHQIAQETESVIQYQVRCMRTTYARLANGETQYIFLFCFYLYVS